MGRTQKDVLVELLVIQAQTGDSEAVGSLATLFQQELVAYSYRLVADKEIAKDVVQQAWVSVIHGIQRLTDPASFRSWVLRIVHNKSMDCIRQAVRDRSELSKYGRASKAGVLSEDAEPSCELEGLRRMIDSLSPANRALIVLYYEKSLPIREISRILGTTDSAIKSNLYHIRQKLKHQLTQSEREDHESQ